jgi:hypothetical protein
MKNPLKKLLIRSLIEEAIVRSEKTYRHLESAFARAVREEAAELLKNLMTAQLLHRMRLQEAQRNYTPERKRFKEEKSGSIYRNRTVQRADPDPWASPAEILQSALLSKNNTYRAYRRVSENSHLGFVRDLYTYLAHEEHQLIKWLESMKTGKNP